MSTVEKSRQIFSIERREKEWRSLFMKTGRPHMNEAALLPETNPEVEAAEAAAAAACRAPESSRRTIQFYTSTGM